MKIKKRILLLMVVLTIFWLGACTKEKGQSKTNETNKLADKQEVTINVTQELNSIDPSNTVDSNSNIVLNNIYEGLYRLDESNEPIPAGAEKLPEISSDGLKYTIKLKREAKWSNNESVTSYDYVYALKRAISEKNAAENNYLYTNLINADEIIKGEKQIKDLGVIAKDDYTLELYLNKATPYFTALLATSAYFPLKESYVVEKGERFATTSEEALYNGPFILKNFSGPGIDTQWKYKKNPVYWDEKNVKMTTINVEVVKETSTNVNLFETGKADEINISGEYAKNKYEDPTFVIEKPVQTVFLGYNQSQKFYQNENIRRAISLLIDRESITENILGNGVKSSTGLIFSGLYTDPQTKEDFTKSSGNHLKTDSVQAKKLWLAGKKELGMKPESVVTIKMITFENEDMRKVMEYLQGVIDENLVGAKVEFLVYPVSVFMENASKQAFDIYLVSWGADYPDPSSMLRLFRSDSAYNWGKYENKKFDELLKQADTTDVLYSKKRTQDLVDAEKILMDTQGITPIYSIAPTYLRNQKLENVKFHNVGPRFEYTSIYLDK